MTSLILTIEITPGYGPRFVTKAGQKIVDIKETIGDLENFKYVVGLLVEEGLVPSVINNVVTEDTLDVLDAVAVYKMFLRCCEIRRNHEQISLMNGVIADRKARAAAEEV